MSDETLQQAAQRVHEAETSALQEVKGLLDEMAARLTAIDAALTYPVGFPSNAKRIVSELNSSLDYRRSTELPTLLQNINPIQP